MPGEQAQCDWAHFGKLTIGRALRPLMAFVMVLSYSRHLFLRFYLGAAMPYFIRGHVDAFTWFNSVPRVLLYDNLKSAVLERRDEAIRFHPTLLELAAHYRFQPRPVAPARGNEKGRVERAIRFARDAFFAARSFRDVDDLNAQAAAWCAGAAAERLCPPERSRRVREVFAEEQAHLLALPANPFPSEERLAVSVHKTPYVRFDLNDYSDPAHPREPHPDRARQPRYRAHPRWPGGDRQPPAQLSTAARRSKTPAHVAALVADKRAARAHRAQDRLQHAAPSAQALFLRAAERGAHLGVLTRGLLQLLASHGAAALEAAIAAALAEDAAHLAAVRHFIDQHAHARGQRPPIAVALPQDPRAAAFRAAAATVRLPTTRRRR